MTIFHEMKYNDWIISSAEYLDIYVITIVVVPFSH